MLIAILEDNVPAGTFKAAEIRAANPDCPEVEAALRCLEAGAYEVEMNLGAGGMTKLVSVEATPTPRDSIAFFDCPPIVQPRRALASYRGTLAEVRAQSDFDVAEVVSVVRKQND
jgi:hypothetical protein